MNATTKMVTVTVGVDFWSFETDKYYMISPTGTQLSFWAHHSKLNDHPAWPIFSGVLARYHTLPVQGSYDGSTNYQRSKKMEVSLDEMRAFKALYDATKN